MQCLPFQQAVNLVRGVACIDDATCFLDLAENVEKQETDNLLVTDIENETLAKLYTRR